MIIKNAKDRKAEEILGWLSDRVQLLEEKAKAKGISPDLYKVVITYDDAKALTKWGDAGIER